MVAMVPHQHMWDPEARCIWKNVERPVMTQHVPRVRKTSDREAGQTQRDRPERDHGFTIDVTAVPHERFDPGPMHELVTTCAGQRIDTGARSPEELRLQFHRGSSVHTHRWLRIHTCVDGSGTRKYMLSYIIQM